MAGGGKGVPGRLLNAGNRSGWGWCRMSARTSKQLRPCNPLDHQRNNPIYSFSHSFFLQQKLIIRPMISNTRPSPPRPPPKPKCINHGVVLQSQDILRTSSVNQTSHSILLVNRLFFCIIVKYNEQSFRDWNSHVMNSKIWKRFVPAESPILHRSQVTSWQGIKVKSAVRVEREEVVI